MPSVGWIATLRAYGDVFDIQFFFALHLTMTILMCIVWAILFVLTVVAFWKGLIFRSKDEDVLNDFNLALAPSDEKFENELKERRSDSPTLGYLDSDDQGTHSNGSRVRLHDSYV